MTFPDTDHQPEYLLSIRDLHKSFQSGQSRLHVLRGVDLDVRRGEMTVITGSSGSGKSTLLHLVGLMDLPDKGAVEYRYSSGKHAGNMVRIDRLEQTRGDVKRAEVALVALPAVLFLLAGTLINILNWGSLTAAAQDLPPIAGVLLLVWNFLFWPLLGLAPAAMLLWHFKARTRSTRVLAAVLTMAVFAGVGVGALAFAGRPGVGLEGGAAGPGALVAGAGAGCLLLLALGMALSLRAGRRGETAATYRNRELGFVFQAYNLLPDFTALENVLMPKRLGIGFWRWRLEGRAWRKRAFEVLAQVGLEGRTHHLPSQMSGGEKQRMAIARALMSDPPLILCDEPTGNLDVDNSEAVMQLLDELNAQGRTFLIVTHDEEVAMRGGRISRVLRMTRGKLEPRDAQGGAPEKRNTPPDSGR